MNTISITGNLTESKGIKNTTNSCVAKRSIAENLNKDESQFTNLEAWGDVARQLDGMQKGAWVTVDGFLKHSTWTAADGTNRNGTHVVVKAIKLAEKSSKHATAVAAPKPAPAASSPDSVDDGEIEF